LRWRQPTTITLSRRQPNSTAAKIDCTGQPTTGPPLAPVEEGSDTLGDSGLSRSAIDTLALRNVASTGVELIESGSDLQVVIGSETNTVSNRFDTIANGKGIEAITFSDGVTWTLEDILAHTKLKGTGSANTLTGSDYAENLYGFDGADTLNGNDGDDLLVGGDGGDILWRHLVIDERSKGSSCRKNSSPQKY
jgi:Ca2+-binding RTX toxin-like protein